MHVHAHRAPRIGRLRVSAAQALRLTSRQPRGGRACCGSVRVALSRRSTEPNMTICASRRRSAMHVSQGGGLCSAARARSIRARGPALAGCPVLAISGAPALRGRPGWTQCHTLCRRKGAPTRRRAGRTGRHVRLRPHARVEQHLLHELQRLRLILPGRVPPRAVDPLCKVRLQAAAARAYKGCAGPALSLHSRKQGKSTAVQLRVGWWKRTPITKPSLTRPEARSSRRLTCCMTWWALPAATCAECGAHQSGALNTW